MINCLHCNKQLSLVIDLKNEKTNCKSCKAGYVIKISDKKIIVESGKKKVEFYLSDLSFCNNKLSSKTVYELYNKGYVKCTKTLNPNFNDHYNEWELSLNDLKNSALNSAKNKISFLNNKLEEFTNAEEKYSCSKCGRIYSFEEAVQKNFACFICSTLLKPHDSNEDAEMIKEDITYLNNTISILNLGWC